MKELKLIRVSVTCLSSDINQVNDRAHIHTQFCQKSMALLLIITMLCCVQNKWMGSWTVTKSASEPGVWDVIVSGPILGFVQKSFLGHIFTAFYLKRSSQASFKQYLWGGSDSIFLLSTHDWKSAEKLVIGNLVIGHHFYCNSALKQFFKNEELPWEHYYMTGKMVANKKFAQNNFFLCGLTINLVYY